MSTRSSCRVLSGVSTRLVCPFFFFFLDPWRALVDHFLEDQMGVELGKVLAKNILAQLEKPGDVKGHDSSVRMFLPFRDLTWPFFRVLFLWLIDDWPYSLLSEEQERVRWILWGLVAFLLFLPVVWLRFGWYRGEKDNKIIGDGEVYGGFFFFSYLESAFFGFTTT